MLPFQRGLIVSCQSNPGDALHGVEHMRAMAVAAEKGGAVGVRANGPDDVSAMKAVISIPIIGLWRIYEPGCEAYITPTFDSARAIVNSGADAIAFDATRRKRPGGASLEELIPQFSTLGVPLMADISTFEEGLLAAELGVDIVATTLAGFTSYSNRDCEGPDLELLERLVQKLKIPVIAEGRFVTPEQARLALDLGAYAVVIGKAITQPEFITKRFVEKMRLSTSSSAI